MLRVRGFVKDGRLQIDEPVDLPENTVLELIAVPASAEDDLDEEERYMLDEAIAESDAEYTRGEGMSAEVLLDDLQNVLRSA